MTTPVSTVLTDSRPIKWLKLHNGDRYTVDPELPNRMVNGNYPYSCSRIDAYEEKGSAAYVPWFAVYHNDNKVPSVRINGSHAMEVLY